MDSNAIKVEIEKGTDVSNIIDMLVNSEGISRDAARKRVRRVRDNMAKGVSNPAATPATPTTSSPAAPIPQNSASVVAAAAQSNPNVPIPTAVAVTNTGEKICESIMATMALKNVTKDAIMKAHNLNPLEWEVVSLKSNLWQSQAKGGIQLPMYQSKLVVRPRREGDFSIEDIKAYYEERDKSGYQYPQIPLPKMTPSARDDGYVLEIPVADMHVGLLSWRLETGEDFDLKIVRDQFLTAIQNLVNTINQFKIPIKEIKLVTLGDVLHVDNDQQTTTKGTFQQVEGRIPKIYTVALEMMESAITLLEPIAPIEYIYLSGNHDRVLGFALAMSIQRSFKDHKTIKFDVTPSPHKYRKFGKTMVAWSHGDMNKKNLESMCYNIADDLSGIRSQHIHVGHLHNSNFYTTNDGRTMVEHINSLCAHSFWEKQQGYGAVDVRYLYGFLWDGGSTPPLRIVGAVE